VIDHRIFQEPWRLASRVDAALATKRHILLPDPVTMAADRAGALVQLAEQVEHFGGNILIHRPLIDGPQSVGDLTIILGGPAFLVGGIALHA
jgi:hypothetical protein